MCLSSLMEFHIIPRPIFCAWIILFILLSVSFQLTSGLSSQQSSPSVKLSGSGVPKQNQQRDASGRIIRSILVNKDARKSRSEQQNHAPNRDMDRRPPRYSNVPPILKESNSLPDDKVSGHDVHGFYSEKQDKRTRNKDRPDRGVWTPLRRSDGSHASDESLSSLNSQSTLVPPESAEGMVIEYLMLA